ncbi:hypothetical protein [Falsarthrobacter nasiphocae]|uniref:Uncharacterized protein n=1 Tax=Falsarthrobacter nasiphocae TaxID=189863 RepID=A0AAE3YFQ6_9MICC|nr:hypothetical protein [Falsarthrobacter nasiphocae]MDR6892335.1 hypothetical protein [Falsarthrobacter nasiphocae]
MAPADGPSRRRIVAAGAWAVPVVAAASAVPASAASQRVCSKDEITGPRPEAVEKPTAADAPDTRPIKPATCHHANVSGECEGFRAAAHAWDQGQRNGGSYAERLRRYEEYLRADAAWLKANPGCGGVVPEKTPPAATFERRLVAGPLRGAATRNINGDSPSDIQVYTVFPTRRAPHEHWHVSRNSPQGEFLDPRDGAAAEFPPSFGAAGGGNVIRVTVVERSGRVKYNPKGTRFDETQGWQPPQLFASERGRGYSITRAGEPLSHFRTAYYGQPSEVDGRRAWTWELTILRRIARPQEAPCFSIQFEAADPAQVPDYEITLTSPWGDVHHHV